MPQPRARFVQLPLLFCVAVWYHIPHQLLVRVITEAIVPPAASDPNGALFASRQVTVIARPMDCANQAPDLTLSPLPAGPVVCARARVRTMQSAAASPRDTWQTSIDYWRRNSLLRDQIVMYE